MVMDLPYVVIVPCMRTRLGLLSTLLLLSAIGCYSYLPINVAPKVGERVRIALTPQGSVELARYLGPRVTMAEGALNSIASDGAYVVSVDWVQTADGVRQPWSGEGSVSVPLQYVAETRERTY